MAPRIAAQVVQRAREPYATAEEKALGQQVTREFRGGSRSLGSLWEANKDTESVGWNITLGYVWINNKVILIFLCSFYIWINQLVRYWLVL